jgi:hypothetical protein
VALTGALLLRAGNAGIFVAATLMLLFFCSPPSAGS